DSASAPASRTVSFMSRTSRASAAVSTVATPSPRASASAKRQSFDAHGGSIDAIAKFQIVRRHHRLEDFEQVTGDGHLADRIAELAVLDPEAGGAAAIVAGDAVDAGADQVG